MATFNPKLKSIDPRVIHSSIKYHLETSDEALFRYHGFGKSIFELLWKEYPELKYHFTFLKDKNTDDIWSFCEIEEHKFGIQLDPDTMVICLWDLEKGYEIGDWETNPEAKALSIIKREFM